MPHRLFGDATNYFSKNALFFIKKDPFRGLAVSLIMK
tara:strand:+ start:2027 stop:2137 length:111 start_codon:yes stop_codon:yes gene_type:complete